jgi:hypothetical protein
MITGLLDLEEERALRFFKTAVAIEQSIRRNILEGLHIRPDIKGYYIV